MSQKPPDGAVRVGLLAPRPKQQEFFDACDDPDAREILFTGSIRGGKTQACCSKIAEWAAERPGTTHLVARKTYQELEDTTKKVMLEGESGLEPALPRELIERQWPTNVPGGNKVRLWNGSEILFRSLEDPVTAEDKIKNITLASFFIDQIEELDDPAYDSRFYQTLMGRLSDPRGPRRGIAAANPSHEAHWVYERYDPEGRTPETRMAGTRCVNVTIYDNAEVLHPEYVEWVLSMETHKPDWFARMALGKWGAMEGKRFECFRERHVIPAFDVPEEWEITEGGDYGWTHPFGWVWHACAPDGHEYFVAEYQVAKEKIRNHAAAIKDIRKGYGLQPSAVWLDPSAWAQRGEYESPAYELAECGINAGKAQNERLAGWDRLEDLFTETIEECTCPIERADSPRLMVFDRCKGLIKQVRNAKIREGTDDVEKVNDDLIDPARYVVMSRPYYRLPEVKGAVTDRMERYVRRLKDKAENPRPEPLILGG